MPGRHPTTAETRRRNLKLLADQWNGPTNLAKKLKWSGPSYVTQLVNGHRPITEKTARRVEEILDLSANWLDTPHDGRAPPTLDAELLAATMAMVLAECEARDNPASPKQISEIVNLAYENAKATGGRPDLDYIKALLNIVS